MRKPFYILQAMRPRQWTKNLVVFAGLIFSKHITDQILVMKSVEAFIIFCILSGMIYLINDIADLEKDKLHEVKKLRPLPSGKLKVREAVVVALILSPAALYASYEVGERFLIVTGVFFVFNLTYSFLLKKIVLLDVFSISISFLMRAIAGVEALNAVDESIELSPWLLICTLFLSLFLAFCKRRHELVSMEDAALHRESLSEYSPRLLDQLVGITAGGAVFSYSIYTIWPDTVEKFQTTDLIYTIPLVLLGVMRYLYLVYSKDKGGCPSEMLITEKFLLIDVFAWIVLVIAIFYVF
jgi:4-hydroxybenzoate polyprenyltransferase